MKYHHTQMIHELAAALRRDLERPETDIGAVLARIRDAVRLIELDVKEPAPSLPFSEIVDAWRGPR